MSPDRDAETFRDAVQRSIRDLESQEVQERRAERDIDNYLESLVNRGISEARQLDQRKAKRKQAKQSRKKNR